MERGLGTGEKAMSSIELNALLKEREAIRKRVLLKYRGVPYIKTK